jgi:glycosyltransferase involved in cell wall biosynthesis
MNHSKIHYHSECSFFAGCENMLVNFLNSEELKSEFELSFSYVYSISYQEGFIKRVYNPSKTYPIYFIDLYDNSKLPTWLPILLKKLILKIGRPLISFPFLIYQVIVLFRLFNNIKPDILHINNGGYPGAKSARAAVLAGKLASVPKIIMVVNNMAVNYNNVSRFFEYPIDRLIAKNVSLFITGSKAAGIQLQKVLRLPLSKTEAIHNGITLRTLTCNKNQILNNLGLYDFKGVIFGVVALLIPRKGHKILLQSVLNLVNERKIRDTDFKVLIEGNGYLREELVSFVKDNSIEQYISFIGEHENIVNFMSVIDVLILSSIQDEDFPNVILEAMGLGKPVISSNLAGTPEQVTDRLTGLLVQPGNITELEEAMLKLIENKSLRKKMGENAIEIFNKQFSAQKSVTSYMNLYRNFIKEINYEYVRNF